MRVSKLLLFIITLIIIVSGCSHGQLSTPPRISVGTTPANLTLIRKSGVLTGGGVSYKVSIDEQDLVMMRNGSYTKLPINPGIHSISFSSFQLPIGWFVEDRIEENFVEGTDYYISIGPLEIILIDSEKANKMIPKLDEIELSF